MPNGLKQYCILYLAGGIFVPILIKKLCDLASKPVKRKFNIETKIIQIFKKQSSRTYAVFREDRVMTDENI